MISAVAIISLFVTGTDFDTSTIELAQHKATITHGDSIYCFTI